MNFTPDLIHKSHAYILMVIYMNASQGELNFNNKDYPARAGYGYAAYLNGTRVGVASNEAIYNIFSLFMNEESLLKALVLINEQFITSSSQEDLIKYSVKTLKLID